MDVSKYRDIFFTEAREHLSQLNSTLVRFEKEGDFSSSVNDLFRSVHTIKGMSAAMGYEPLSEFSHELENLFDGLKKTPPTEEDIELLFNSFDAMETLIGQAEREEPLQSPGDVVHRVKARTRKVLSGGIEDSRQKESHYASGAEAKVLPVDDGIPACRVAVALEPSCAFRIARAMVVIGTLDSMGRVLKCDPEVAEADEGDFEGQFTVYYQCAEPSERIQAMVASVPEVRSVSILPFEDTVLPESPGGAAPETVTKRDSMDRAMFAKETVRLNVRHLEALMAATETLVLDRAALARLSEQRRDRSLERLVSSLTRNLTDLQYEVMQARMVPASEILDRFPRMIRDLAKDLGKEVDLVCEGRDTEFDRSLLEHLGDPLVHLLRNSIHHGIESPGDRAASGKPRRGTLRVEAKRERNGVVFVVEDDGGGIDRHAVIKKALSSGLVAEADAETMGFDDVLELIMSPGFSTAKEVSEVSGRGVGLDVVRHTIRSLGGTLNIESTWQKGTRCVMSLPITLAIIRALMVEVGGEEYAIPLGNVSGVLSASETEMRLVNSQWMLAVEDQLIPIVKMSEALGSPDRTVADGRPQAVVLVGMGSRRTGLVFDRLVEQQDIVVKGLGNILRRVEGFSGVTIGGDGRPILILDVASFV